MIARPAMAPTPTGFPNTIAVLAADADALKQTRVEMRRRAGASVL